MQMTTKSIVVAGAGGNTGSHLLPHLARMILVSRLILVDPDVYDAGNLMAQNIDSRDIGRPKVEAQAEKLRLLNPHLDVIALQERIEDVPRGLLRCDLIVSTLDSRIARQYVNEIAWRLNIPWIDNGILGSQNLARVNYYPSSPNAACLICPWGPEDFLLVEQEYLCSAGSGAALPTMASSALGALASSLMALEIAKLFARESTVQENSWQLLLDAQNHILRTSTCRRNPDCRFDHRTWSVQTWRRNPELATVASTLKELGSLQIEGHRFVRELICPDCQQLTKALRLNRPLARCCACGRRMVSSGFGSLENLNSETTKDFADLTLAQIGLRVGDIISSGNNNHWLLEAV
jgi:hypothetical protein